jgi:uncharacterized protein YkwD
MRYTILLAVALLVACSGQQRQVTAHGDVPKTRTSGDPYAECDRPQTRRVVELANGERDATLYCDRELAAIAQRHADDMCEHGYLSHTSRDGRTMQDRADRAGVDYMALGENVAMGQPTADRVHEGWMGSPNHRANIVHEMFSRLGVGYAPCGGQPYWVQVFAN